MFDSVRNARKKRKAELDGPEHFCAAELIGREMFSTWTSGSALPNTNTTTKGSNSSS
jgi:hypothetical protein